MSQPVAVVIQTRIRPGGEGAYAAWQARAGAALQEWPGFVAQEVVQPNPPLQVDWFVIQRFESEESAYEWMQSDNLKALLAEISDQFVGNDTISVLRDATTQGHVSAAISCKVPPEQEAAFLDWQRRVFQAESAFPGFVGHKLERPIGGLRDNWSVMLTFDSEQNLDGWLGSTERQQLVDEGEHYQSDVHVSKTNYGFGFWSKSPQQQAPTATSIFKSNLLVLLVLYPFVFLWGYLISEPFIDSKGAPFWLSLFIGNVASTQLLGFWVAPIAFKAYDKWMQPKPSMKTELIGYVTLAVLYLASMGLFAWILTLPKLSGN